MTFAILPHVFIFQTTFSGPPLNPSKVFIDPSFGFSVTIDPPFCSPKNQVTPPPPQKKILPPLGYK